MKRLIFSFLIVLLGLSLLALLGYVLIRLNPNRHREQIIQWVESRYNVKLKLGLIFPILYPGIGLEVKELELALPDPERAQPELFKTKSVKLILDLKQLLKAQRVQIKGIILNQPEFYLELSSKEKQRLSSLKKPKDEGQKKKEEEKERSLSRKFLNFILRRYPIQFSPEDLLATERVLISKARGKIYDQRDKPKKLKAPLEFGNLDLLLTKGAEKNSFQFWFGADHPYHQSGLTPLRFEGKGKMIFSWKPLEVKVNFDEAKWGENPFSKIQLELGEKESKFAFTGIVAGKVNLEQAVMNLKWAPLRYSQFQEKLKLWGEAEYQYQIKPGANNWERFFNIDQASLKNVRMVLYDPKGKTGKILKPIILGNAQIEVRGIQGENPGWVRMVMPFPYQEPLGDLKPLELAMEGRIRLARNWSIIEFNSEKGTLGSNQMDQLNLTFTRTPGAYSLKAGLNLRINDLSEFKSLLLWEALQFMPQLKFMNFSGKGRLLLDLRYPEPGESPLWYQGVLKLHQTSFDPGMVIYPIEKFNGELKFSPQEIFMPPYWFSISGMPIQSDFSFTRTLKAQRPRIKLKSTVNDLDLSQLFASSSRKRKPKLEIGEPLGPVATIWVGEFLGNRVKYKKFATDQVKGKWRFKDRMVNFPNLTLKYKKGWFQDGGTWIDFRQARVSEFHFKGHFEEFPFKKIMDELFGYDFFVEGKATGEGYLSGRFVDGKLQKDSLNGYFKMVVRDGNLIGYNLGLRLLQFMGFKVDQSKGGYPFQRAKTELVFKQGVIYFDEMEIKNPALEAHCAGQIDLVNETLKLWVSAYPLELLATVTKPIPLIGALINQTQESLFGYYAKAEGPWKDIKIQPYLPLAEKVPKAPKPEPFPARPYEPKEKEEEKVLDEKP